MKKLGLWLASISLIVCSSIAAAGCNLFNNGGSASSTESAAVQEYVEIGNDAISMEVFTQHTFKLTTNAQGTVVWTTSNEGVATVEKGVVTAKSVGSATITATVGNVSATCLVTVTHLSGFPALTVSESSLELVEGGGSIFVEAVASYKGEAVDSVFTWTTANPSVATVVNGTVTPVGVGETTIVVTAVCMGETLTKEIPVVVKVDEQIQLSKAVMALTLAQFGNDGKITQTATTETFTAQAYLKGVVNNNVTFSFSSSDNNVASVSANGNEATVTAVGLGTCVINVSYESANTTIISSAEVTVSRLEAVLNNANEVEYVDKDSTALDVASLGLVGEFEGVYFNGELVSDTDGTLLANFVEVNKGVSGMNVELRTSVVSYATTLSIRYTPPLPPINTEELYLGETGTTIPAYEGDVTAFGFAEGTTIYEVVQDNRSNMWEKGTNLGLTMEEQTVKVKKYAHENYVSIQFSLSREFTGEVAFFAWWIDEDDVNRGSAGYVKVDGTPREAPSGFKSTILDLNGNQVTSIKAKTVYELRWYGEGATAFKIGCCEQNGESITVYYANASHGIEIEPMVTQGEGRKPMPTYVGDVTALGFEAGTVVYEIVGPQSNASDVKLVAKVDATGDNAFAKLDFVLSKTTPSIGLWITAENTHLGYYTITPTGFTADGIGDPTRNIFVTDSNGDRVTSFQENTTYTLYVGLDGREKTVQLTTWADLTMYVANIACITEVEAPVEPLPPVQGEEISILFIGNSFSDDTEAYMVDILLNLGYTNINIGNLYIGGCSIDMHYQNAISDANAYEFRMRSHNGKKYTEYEPVSVGGRTKSISFAVAYKDWDIISVQQASGESGKADTYNNLDALVDKVKKQATNKDVEIVFNMTWAYQGNSTHAQFPDYNSDQMTMYNAIVSAVQSEVSYTVVPNGTAIQNARTSMLGDTLTRDGYHLDLKIGRFIAGLTFVAKVTGVDLEDLTYAPSGISDTQYAIVLESVQNALNNPFTITESEIQEEIVVKDPDVTAGGTNANAVSKYTGDVTALGFAEGTTVYQYVGTDSVSDKAAIKVDSVNYDYVEFDFVIGSGDGYFFGYVLKNGSFLNGGASYVIDPSNLRLANGNAMDRVIRVFEANGESATTLMKTNTLYKMRVFIKAGNVDQVMIAKAGSTIYLANVTFGLAGELPVEGPIKQGNTSNALPNYTGDETAVGFEEGEYLQYVATETLTGEWWQSTSLDSNGKTREQLSAKIFGEAGKYVTVKFAVSEDIASGDVFYVWGLLGETYTQNGGVNFTSTTHGRILDEKGHAVTSIKKNTVYILELYMEGTDRYNVANICKTGMELYFASNSIACSDTPMGEVAPDEEETITAGGTNVDAVSKYTGDVTALGFAEGTTVYQYVGTDSVSDKAAIKVDSVNYDYVEFDFVIGSGDGYFFGYVLKNGSFLNNGASYVIDPSNLRLANGNVMDRVIQVFEANGQPAATLMKTNTLYKMRVFIKAGNVDQVMIGKSGSTIYLANVTFGLAADLPVEAPIKYAETQVSLSKYAGDVTALGFSEGATVYEQTIADGWNDRVTVNVDNTYDYVDIQFVVPAGSLCLWVNNASGMLQGNYTVNSTGVVSAENGALERKMQVLDEAGNVITSAMETGKVYTLRVYIEGLTKVQISTYSGVTSIYYGDVSFGNDAVSDMK